MPLVSGQKSKPTIQKVTLIRERGLDGARPWAYKWETATLKNDKCIEVGCKGRDENWKEGK
jgi:hypothetical protein